MNKLQSNSMAFGRPTFGRVRRCLDVLIGAVALVALIAASFATFHNAHAFDGESIPAAKRQIVAEANPAQYFQVPENPVQTGLRAAADGGNASEVSPSTLPEFRADGRLMTASLIPPMSGRYATLAGLVMMLAGLCTLIFKMWREAACNMARTGARIRESRRIN